MAEIVLSKEQLKKIHSIEMDILSEVDRICKKYDIKYSLAYGTLLGAVRHKGFIPWDDDVDIWMLREDYVRFSKICATELSEKFFYQSYDTDPEYYYLYNKIRVNGTVFKESFLANKKIHHGIYIDIFPIDYVPESSILRKLQYCKLLFFRCGLMAKYLNISERKGMKKIAAMIARVVYAFFSLDYLYKKAVCTATQYDDKEGRYIYDFCDLIGVNSLCEKEGMEKTVEMSFEKYNFSVRSDYKKVLHTEYGDYMRLPPEDKRISNHYLSELKL